MSEKKKKKPSRREEEDREDLAAFEERKNEPEITYEELLKSLKKQGKI